MGADFMYITIPKFKVTDEIVKEFNSIVDKLDDFDDPYLGIGYTKVDIKRAFEELKEFELRRDVAEIYLCENNDLKHYITGGLSWGDAPTDAFDILCILQDAMSISPELEAKVEEWHKMEVADETKSK